MVTVTIEETGLRLDRWLSRHCPEVPHGRLQKWLRTGQVRIDGRRAKAGARLAEGEAVRLPPIRGEAAAHPRPSPASVDVADAEALRKRVLYRDAYVLALDKPAGLAVQGGSGTHRHLDGMLDALRFDANERPRLVHRLDKDTSGVLMLARDAAAAAHPSMRGVGDVRSRLHPHERGQRVDDGFWKRKQADAAAVENGVLL